MGGENERHSTRIYQFVCSVEKIVVRSIDWQWMKRRYTDWYKENCQGCANATTFTCVVSFTRISSHNHIRFLCARNNRIRAQWVMYKFRWNTMDLHQFSQRNDLVNTFYYRLNATMSRNFTNNSTRIFRKYSIWWRAGCSHDGKFSMPTYRKSEVFRWIYALENLCAVVRRRFKYMACCVVVHR